MLTLATVSSQPIVIQWAFEQLTVVETVTCSHYNYLGYCPSQLANLPSMMEPESSNMVE